MWHFTDDVQPNLTHLVLADLVGGPGMDSLDHGGAAAHVEVENFHCPAPAGGQHQVWVPLGNAGVHRGGVSARSPRGPRLSKRGWGWGAEDKGEARAEQISR